MTGPGLPAIKCSACAWHIQSIHAEHSIPVDLAWTGLVSFRMFVCTHCYKTSLEKFLLDTGVSDFCCRAEFTSATLYALHNA